MAIRKKVGVRFFSVLFSLPLYFGKYRYVNFDVSKTVPTMYRKRPRNFSGPNQTSPRKLRGAMGPLVLQYGCATLVRARYAKYYMPFPAPTYFTRGLQFE